MKKQAALPSKWVLPIVTAVIVLLAICLPERISALRDRSLFAAAHVEDFDSALGMAESTMTLGQRLNELISIYYGETTDTYLRTEDTFTVEEKEALEKLFFGQMQALFDTGTLPLPGGLSTAQMECYDRQRVSVWDSVTLESASFVHLFYYDKVQGGNVDMVLDEASGLPVMLTIVHPLMEELFAGDDGQMLAEIGERFVQALGLSPQETKYLADDAYVILQNGSDMPDYHVSQKYEVLTIEPMPDFVVRYAENDFGETVSIIVNAGTDGEVMFDSYEMMEK